MLLAVLPLTLVASTVRIRVNAVPVLLVVNVLAFILAAIGPDIVALSMHVVLIPVAFVNATILP